MKNTSLGDLHVHSSFCEGRDTPRAIVLAAIEAGMEVIGFSEHSHVPPDPLTPIPYEKIRSYRAELASLQNEFGDRVKILCGIEQDYFSDPMPDPRDYTIGAVHYVCIDGAFCPVDGDVASLHSFVHRHLRGDYGLLIREYYQLVSNLEAKTQCDIIGHFDLITKCNENNILFDENAPYYRKPVIDALDALLDKHVIFEINTTALAQGNRRKLYPSPYILRYIAMNGGDVTVHSDAHSKDQLRYGFDIACQYAHSCGFSSVLSMTQNGWKRISI